MKTIFASVVLSMFALSPALAHPDDDDDNRRGDRGNDPVHDVRGAPAPLLGAGLPGIGIAAGYGAYWIARRRRRNKVAA